ncbi:hypothetical protein [Pimelobacter sp. 30-1]|uniref:hypothetical protein n=1 Tax=Pimelobacter sp. 30-1 TaxID=2004991 RepID=UPI001C04D020|nr:hypothetical protein [Pimelobacter sp. 30-1]MBU2696325.1 hypothetical protein [Pimelobacter sp. 30-1]
MTGLRTKLVRTSIAATLSSALLLSGCGGGDDGKDAGKKDSQETSSTTSSPSGGASASDGAGTDGGSSAGTGNGTGSLDKATFFKTIADAQKQAGSYKATGTTSVQGTSVTTISEARYDGDKLLAHAKTSPKSGQQYESVLAGGVIYLQGAGLPVPAGKWLKFDPKDKSNASSPLAPILALADPQKQLAVFGSPKALTLVGEENVEGVDTSHYRVTVDSAAFAKNAGLPADAGKLLPPELTIDLWLDGDDRPIKMRQEFEIQGAKSTTEQVYTDYGADVKIDVPADKDTVTPSQAGIA